jgi:CRISPR/Cas system CSM-associated protein Csm2 small subunit
MIISCTEALQISKLYRRTNNRTSHLVKLYQLHSSRQVQALSQRSTTRSLRVVGKPFTERGVGLKEIDAIVSKARSGMDSNASIAPSLPEHEVTNLASLRGFHHVNEYGIPVDENDDSITIYDYSSNASSERSHDKALPDPTEHASTHLRRLNAHIQEHSQEFREMSARQEQHQSAMNYLRRVSDRIDDSVAKLRHDRDNTIIGSDEYKSVVARMTSMRVLQYNMRRRHIEYHEEILKVLDDKMEDVKTELRHLRRARSYLGRVVSAI